MDALHEEKTALVAGDALGGGFYAGKMRIDGQLFALIVAPKIAGQHEPIALLDDLLSSLIGQSYCDGLANTVALAGVGSSLARWARGLNIGGHRDWYLPSQDELEMAYRLLKPTRRENWCYVRSGINLNSDAPGLPYTPAAPAQTAAELFREGAVETFDAAWYWASTMHVADRNKAWFQDFRDGNQLTITVNLELRARAFRREPTSTSASVGANE